jgi:polar amino acid transport system substrate-binding protein
MRHFGLLAVLLMTALAGGAAADDGAAKRELTPTGKLRLGIALGPTIGAGNVVMDAASGKPRGIAVDLGNELADKLAVPIEYIGYPNSGALTDASAATAWDLAFIPVDEERKKKVDFGAAHIVLQSTWLVAAASPIATLADVDKPGTRAAAVENTATARAAARSLQNNTLTLVKTAEELFELIRSGKADAVAQSREALTAMAAKLPGARVLDGGYLSSYVAVAVPKGRPAALAYVTAFVEEAKASGSVRRALDHAGLRSSVVAPAGVRP